MRATAPDRSGGNGPLAGMVHKVAGHLLDHPTSKACQLARDWRMVAGRELAAHTEPIRMVNGTLTVRVDSSAWAAEMQFRAPEILSALREQLQIETVKSLRCKTETLKFAPAPPPAPPPPLRPPTQEEQARAAELTAGIEDTRLQRAVMRLLLVNMVCNSRL
ncbi:MAG: DUF721 domain-containing protein [Magnetococcales bacterium]|nr:DUF721 domain-containing protein [Magnetococcales bacterium]